MPKPKATGEPGHQPPGADVGQRPCAQAARAIARERRPRRPRPRRAAAPAPRPRRAPARSRVRAPCPARPSRGPQRRDYAPRSLQQAPVAPAATGAQRVNAGCSRQPLAGHLGPGVAQADGAVEHRACRASSPGRGRNSPAARTAPARRIVAPASAGSSLRVGQHFERIRIEVGGEIRGVRARAS